MRVRVIERARVRQRESIKACLIRERAKEADRERERE